VDAELVAPLAVKASDPVSARESVLAAGEDREAFVDVAVDLEKLLPGVSVAEVVAPTAQNAVEVLDGPFQRLPRVAAVRPVADLAVERR
jgi:hypothetical protein